MASNPTKDLGMSPHRNGVSKNTYVDVDILIARICESEGDKLVGSIQNLGFIDVC